MTAALLTPILPIAASAAAPVASRGDAPPPLGSQRTLLVIADDAELAVALRDRLDRALLTVYDVRRREALVAIRACRPWPWMVVGDAGQLAEPVREALESHPILLLWRGQAPPGLRRHLAVLQSFSELAAGVEAALGSGVAGMRLAVGSGLTMPDGSHVSNPALEALVASHPRPVCLTRRQLRTATAALASHKVALRPQQAPGGVVLAAAEDA